MESEADWTPPDGHSPRILVDWDAINAFAKRELPEGAVVTDRRVVEGDRVTLTFEA